MLATKLGTALVSEIKFPESFSNTSTLTEFRRYNGSVPV